MSGPTVSLVVLAVLMLPQAAEAYVDPTGGGFLLQLLLGGGTAVVLIGRMFLKRLLARLGRRSRDTK